MPAYIRTRSEFAVNSFGANSQIDQKVATFADGGFLVTWLTFDETQDGSDTAIKGQFFDSAGSKVGFEFLVNTISAGSQFGAEVKALSNGNFVVSWTNIDPGGNYSVQAQMFERGGAPIGGAFRVDPGDSAYQASPNIAALADGGFVISWDGTDSRDVTAQIFDSAGAKVGAAFTMNTNTAHDQDEGDVTALAGGGFIATWRTNANAGEGYYDARAQIFSASGAKVGPEFLVNSRTAGDQYYPRIAALPDGGFVIVWFSTENSPEIAYGTIKAQIYSASGEKVGAEISVETESAGNQFDPVVAAVPGGGFMVAWTTQPGYGSQIKAQMFDSAGSKVGGEMLVNKDPWGTHNNVEIEALADGRVIATWVSWEGDSEWTAVRAQILGTEEQAPLANTAPTIISNGAGDSVSLTHDEMILAVTTVVASDDGEPNDLIYSISSLEDGALFAIDSRTGVLSFLQPPDHEAPLDQDGDNVYLVSVAVSDGELTDYQDFSIYVRHLNRVEIVSNGGEPWVEILFSENETEVTTVAAVENDGLPIAYSISGGEDAALFTIDPLSGKLSFAAAPDFESPEDGWQDNYYYVTVTASDGTVSDSQVMQIVVQNVNEAVTITSGGGGATASYSVAENMTAVTVVTSADADGTAATYSITGGADASRFAIDSATGALRFVAAPNFESRTDSNVDNIYNVIVSATDGEFTDSQALAVTVTNVNEAPVFQGSETNYLHIENLTEVDWIYARDPEGSAVTWSIAGGPDAAHFAINPTNGVLRFITAPNFEAPGDVGANNFYNVTIAVSDGSLTSTRALTIEMLNRDEGPIIVSAGGGDTGSVSVVENKHHAATIVADDPDARDGAVTFSIVGGADAALFVIQAQTGQLFFRNNVGGNYEAPHDSGGNNVYDVIVSVSDGFNTPDTQALAITVLDANDPPAIISNGGGFLASVSVSENQRSVTTVTATDLENGPLAYAIIGGADAALFTIDAQTGVLRFKDAPDREAPRDAGANNVYDVHVSVSDGEKTDTQQLSVTVLNDPDEAPVITSNGGGSTASITVGENSVAVTNVAARDPEGKPITYSLAGGGDESRFVIDSATGVLSFVSPPDYEAPRDYDRDNVYTVFVGASDGSKSIYQYLSVTVANLNFVDITSDGGNDWMELWVDENETAVTIVEAMDDDGAGFTYSLSGDHADHFTIDAQTGRLSFTAAADYEMPGGWRDQNIFYVTVTVSAAGASDSQAMTIYINDVPELELVYEGEGQDGEILVAENGTAVTTIGVTGAVGPVTYRIVGGDDAQRFVIDAQTGILSFASEQDYETGKYGEPSPWDDEDYLHLYKVVVRASDGAYGVEKELLVRVQDVDEAPGFYYHDGADHVAVSVAENIVGTVSVAASDPDKYSWVTYTLEGADAALFEMSAYHGGLRFRQALDREAPIDADGDNVYEVTVVAHSGALSATQSFSITIEDEIEPVSIISNGGGDSATLLVPENSTAVTVLVADGGGPVHYEIVGGVDAGWFTLDPVSGALAFVSPPDYERTRKGEGHGAHGTSYYVVVRASNDDGSHDDQSLTILVQDADEAPRFFTYGGVANVALTVNENVLAVANPGAWDPDRGQTVSYSIAGGADSALFQVDPTSGALTLKQGADFEAPADSDGDNVYQVTVSANSGALSATQSFSITIADVNENVVITSNGGGASATVSVAENGSAVTAVAAASGLSVTYSIVGGADAAAFSINASTGALAFASTPDFEKIADFDRDNVFEVTVRAGNGMASDDQNLSVALTNVNEGVAITTGPALSVSENSGFVATIAATDGDGDPVSYAIAGGADASLFAIDAQSGALSFVQAPDFEAPADAGGDNVYDVIVSASDGTLTGSRAMAVTVSNSAENVAITSNGGGTGAQIRVAENGTAVTLVQASDPDGGPVTYAIAGGADAALFTIDPNSGALAFVAAPDFESTRSAGGGNEFSLVVSASDGSSTDSQALSIVLDNVVEGVFITSNGGADSVSATLAEGQFTTYDVDAWHDTGVFAPIVYSLSGADAAFFTIDSQGRFSFDYDAPPNFEGPADSDGDNVYDVTVTASIGGYSDSQAFAITILNRDENVVFTSGGGEPFASFTVAENGSAVTTVSAVDPEGGAVTYAISGGFDAALFTIDPGTGALAFITAPDFEHPADHGGDGVYNVSVTATDGTFVASQFMDITVENVDEPIEVLSYGGAASVALTLTEGTGLTVGKVEADDPEDWTVTYSITGGTDAALFRVDAYTGVLAFNHGVYPDFETPADAGGDNVYDVVVTASSSTSSADQAFAITLADRNEGLWITSNGGGDASLTMDEGGRSVTIVTAQDQDGDVPAYSIVGGADSALFAIDPATGALTFIAAPDYEAPGSAAGTNVYLVEVGASDGEFLGTQRIRIQIGNVNEAPVITSGGGGTTASVTVNENGLAAANVTATDVDGNMLTYSIAGGADAPLFAIDARTGALRFVQAPNFEAPADAGANNVYDVLVSVTDGLLTDSQAVAVTVANLAEIVTITSNGGGSAASVAVGENGIAVTTVTAGSPDGGAAVTYAIAGGADAARFTIDAATGALAFLAAPNFEAPADNGANNVYDVVVSASNGATSDTQALAVTVGNVNEPMAITSNGGGAGAAVSVTENGTAVTIVAASDPDGGPLTYAIVGGADSGRFIINATTGVLAFRAAPDFEAPGDSGGNNVYDVIVWASDGSYTDTQSIAVTVGNVNEAPVITSSGGGATGNVSVAENNLLVAVVAATDPEGAAAVYSIVGGADAARFTINAQTGVLQFIAAPDWEMPGNSSQNNVYAVVVRASDGLLVDDQALSVTVTNARDGNNVTGTSGNDTISATSTNLSLRTSNEEDLAFGRDGHDSIYGLGGDDELYGEGGNDVLAGGEGSDKLLGGLGKDQFTYAAVSDSTAALRDLIMDFSRAQGDKISLSAIDSNSALFGNQAFTFIGTAAFSNTAGQLRYETAGGMTTVFGDVNGDGVADLQIQLSGSIALISSDFIL